MKQLIISISKGRRVILTGNIVRVKASSWHRKMYFSNECPLLVASVLRWFDNNLPDEIFCRIHRIHLVNRMCITGVSKRSSLALKSGEIIKISRRRKREYQFTPQEINR